MPSDLSGRPTRRSALVGAAAALAAPAVWTGARAQSRELLVYAWYPIPMQAIMRDFAKETNVNVKFIGSYGGNPVWWSQLIAGQTWDVFLPSMDWMTRAALAGKIEPLDLKRIPNVKNLSASGRRAVADELTVNGQVCALPWALTINSLDYNSKAIGKAKAEANWDVMWDPAFAGKLTTKDEAIIPILTAAARLNIQTRDIGSWTPAQMNTIRKSLLEQKKLIRKYWSKSRRSGGNAGYPRGGGGSLDRRTRPASRLEGRANWIRCATSRRAGGNRYDSNSEGRSQQGCRLRVRQLCVAPRTDGQDQHPSWRGRDE